MARKSKEKRGPIKHTVQLTITVHERENEPLEIKASATVDGTKAELPFVVAMGETGQPLLINLAAQHALPYANAFATLTSNLIKVVTEEKTKPKELPAEPSDA